MIEKYCPIDEFDRSGAPNVRVLSQGDGALTKEASATLPPELEAFISTMRVDPKYIYLLINAMGAGEATGSNRNGDFFEEEELKKHHGTFVTDAKVYKHHVNKPGSPSYGDVLTSYWNPGMHRVELLLRIDKEKSPELVERVDKNDPLAFSMGCKVKYDICSICKNKAKTVAEYCSHLQRGNINKIDPVTGRKAYAINPSPRFFDISAVRVPADRTAYAMRKVASMDEPKEATITKEIEGTSVVSFTPTVGEKIIRASQPDMPLEVVAEVCKLAYSFEDLLGMFVHNRFLPTPRDFQNIAIIKAQSPNGEERGFDLARELTRRGTIFPTVTGPVLFHNALPKHPIPNEDNVMNYLIETHVDGFNTKPVVVNRVIRLRQQDPPLGSGLSVKTAEVRVNEGDDPLLDKIGAFYQGFIAEFNRVTNEPHYTTNAKLAQLLYPAKNYDSTKTAGISFNLDASPAYLEVTDLNVEPKGLQLPTLRYTDLNVERHMPNTPFHLLRYSPAVIDELFKEIMQ